MTGDTLPDDVRAFILQHIDSVGHLEALLLLWRCSDRSWSASAVSKHLYVSEGAAAGILSRLHQLGLVARDDDAYRFDPQAQALSARIKSLGEVYAQQLIVVTGLIHSKSASRIQEFADAFWLRKGK